MRAKLLIVLGSTIGLVACQGQMETATRANEVSAASTITPNSGSVFGNVGGNGDGGGVSGNIGGAGNGPGGTKGGISGNIGASGPSPGPNPGPSPGPSPSRPSPSPSPSPGSTNNCTRDSTQCGSSTPKVTPGGSTRVTLFCSDNGAVETTSYSAAIAAGDPVAIAVNGQPCITDTASVTSLLESGQIAAATLSSACPSLIPASGSYTVSLLINGQPQVDQYAPGSPGLFVIWAQNPDDVKLPSSVSNYCTKSESPLVIRIPQDPHNPLPLDLSPAHTIWFDLLGATDDHQKVQIDWFTNLDYRLLVLPNAAGQVLGIDQLFGNNTTGPDGHLAGNGYAALAKYDGMSADGLTRIAPADGFIDQNDPVFSRLKVWLDKNSDGIAQADELVPLSAVNITAINLNYSNTLPETDAYGNQTKFKSKVLLSKPAGTTDLIFDLWFNFSAD